MSADKRKRPKPKSAPLKFFGKARVSPAEPSKSPSHLLEREPFDPASPVSMMDLEPGRCRWIIGEAKGMICCNNESFQPGSPWCADHAKRVFTKA
jgi:hypothetical protein